MNKVLIKRTLFSCVVVTIFIIVICSMLLLGVLYPYQLLIPPIKKSLPLSKCKENENCEQQVRFTLKHVYSFNSNLVFSNRQMTWIWESLHPDLCTLHNEFPGAEEFAHKVDVWDVPLSNFYVNWRIVTPDYLFWEGRSFIHGVVQKEYLPENFNIEGCSIWMLAKINQSYIEFAWFSYYPSSLKIDTIRWACELWIPQLERRGLQEREVSSLLNEKTFDIEPNQLDKLCDWYLWCTWDRSNCISGGRRFWMDVFTSE